MCLSSCHKLQPVLYVHTVLILPYRIKVVLVNRHCELCALNCCHSAVIKCAGNIYFFRISHCFLTSCFWRHSEGRHRRNNSRFRRRALESPTFPPVHERRVHRVYTDTADSCVTPPNSHAPSLYQSALDHVLITRCLRVYWFKFATPLFLIGNMLPPTRLF